MKVFLRKKKMTKGRKSLYLDFYPPVPHPVTGIPTRRQFLKLYVYTRPKNHWERLHNTETLNMAESLRAQRQLSMQAENYGFLDNEKQEADFLAYLKKLAASKSESNGRAWLAMIQYIEDFSGGTLKFRSLTPQLLNDFKEYLLNKPKGKVLNPNSASNYFATLRTALRQAYKDEKIQDNIAAKLDNISKNETQREFCTIEELEKLAVTPCKIPVMKTAALFSALTGLRYSDCEALCWENIQFSKDRGYFITFIIKKTQTPEELPVSELALSLLGERGEGPVFPGLKYTPQNVIILKEWVKEAGIKKKITFHNFRHSFASNQIALKTDIYTLSKLLGHKTVGVTQRYTRGDEKLKREAVNKLQINLNGNNKTESDGTKHIS